MNYKEIKISLQKTRHRNFKFSTFGVYDSGNIQPVENPPIVDYSGFNPKDVKDILHSVELSTWDIAKESGLLVEHTLEVVDKAIYAETNNDEISLEVYNDIIQKSLTELDIPCHT